MELVIDDGVAGARAARGVTVVIDVFRAFSVACYALAAGAERIIPLADAEEALALRRTHPHWLAIGERFGRKLPGFDFGNSPTELERAALGGRTLLHTTHAGTQGLANALAADLVLTGSLVNAAASARYISALAPARVTLVRMGLEARMRSDADDVCAELLAARLTDAAYDVNSIRARLRESTEAAKFFDPQADWAPERDFELCTAIDRFDFVVRLSREGTWPALTRVAVK